MMKKVILLVIAGIGLVSCANDDAVTTPSGAEVQNEVYLNKTELDTTGGQTGNNPIKP